MKEAPNNYLDCIKRVSDFRSGVFEKIAGKKPVSIWAKSSLANVKKVAVINSASRSGSSFLSEALKKIPGIYSLSGEAVPFYKVNGLSSDFFASDEVPTGLEAKAASVSGLSRDFLSDFSTPLDPDEVFSDAGLSEQYVDDLALRFPLQWPGVLFSYDIFRKFAFEALDVCKKAGRGFSVKEFYLELLSTLRREYKAINPYYYDISADMVQKKFPDLKIPFGPPNSILTVEEPLFILLSPARKVTEADFCDNVLLLKSSVDCYRMRFIENLFPNAELKIIYLTRNPAASINGLYDGWLHRGFFSRNMDTLLDDKTSGIKELAISGYSDRFEWGKHWWNFDLPAGWQDYACSSLQQVCGFQWYSANKAVSEYLDKSARDCCRVRCEKLLLSPASCKNEITKIVDFIGLGRDAVKEARLDKLPVVQATQRPENYRWKKRYDMILPVLDGHEVSGMCGRIGYDKGRMEEWI